MKLRRFSGFFFLTGSLLVGCTDNYSSETSGWKLVEKDKLADSLRPSDDSTLYDFHLIYCFAGLGANIGNKGQYFEIKDSTFVFSMKQNSSFENKITLETDTVDTGIIRSSTRDSILNIIRDIQDSTITQRNLEISSGGLISVSIKYAGHKTLFSLHNCYNERADQIVRLLNTYISGDQQLFLYDFPPKDYGVDF